MFVRSSRLALAALPVFLAGCLEPTQFSFEITTDVPCETVSGTLIAAGLEGQTESAEPVTVTRDCRSDGTVGFIGTYAISPRASRDLVASIKVVMAVGNTVDVESDCTEDTGYKNCIVARRRVKFVEHKNLVVPISMAKICTGLPCDANTTCDRAGRCVESLINTSQCTDTGCPLQMTGSGLPCFNEGADTQLFCDEWCTRQDDGRRACDNGPATSGISFQCRDSTDCLPNLQCVQGDAGVVAKCVTMAKVGDTVVCTKNQPLSPCQMGVAGCSIDIGFGLFACLAKVDAGVKLDGGADAGRDGGTDGGSDGGADAGRQLPCPSGSTSLLCSGATPFCSGPTGTPTCVADGGAQCWYPSDCPDASLCFAGSSAPAFSVCAPSGSSNYPVALCNPALGNADCAAGSLCDGVFFGASACRLLDAGTGDAGAVDSGQPLDAGADAGAADSGAIDSGSADAGATDAGSDAGRSDAGSDAGRADAGDGG